MLAGKGVGRGLTRRADKTSKEVLWCGIDLVELRSWWSDLSTEYKLYCGLGLDCSKWDGHSSLMLEPGRWYRRCTKGSRFWSLARGSRCSFRCIRLLGGLGSTRRRWQKEGFQQYLRRTWTGEKKP